MREALWKSIRAENLKFRLLFITDQLFDQLSQKKLIKFYEYHNRFVIQPYDENLCLIEINIVYGQLVKQEDFKVILKDGTEQQLFQ